MTNKEVKAILANMKTNRLYKRVINEIVADSDNYSGKNLQKRILARLEDINHGLQTGIVSSMVWYSDTVRFFNRYKNEIAELWKEFQECTEMTLYDLRGFDKEDPFIREDFNKNLLAWFAYEEIAHQLENELYE